MDRLKLTKNVAIGENLPTFIIAEVSANHGHSLEKAIALIKEAKKAGADAVKFQTYTADSLTIDVKNKHFMIKHPKWGGQSLHELYKRAYTPWKWFKKLKKTADEIGIIFLSTAYDKISVDFLEDIGVPFHKIASFELVDLPLIEYVARTKKPLMMSTGMAKITEIKDAMRTAKKEGVKDIVLLKCASSYPAKPDEMNLRTITHMEKSFNCPIGLSDHTLGIGVSIAAVGLGARVIEKHFTLSRKIKTPDSFFSIEPRELRSLIENVRIVEKALSNKVRYGLTKGESKNLIFRRSLFVVEDVKKGESFTEENVRSIRPSNGLKPKYLKKVIGRKAKKNIKKGTPVSLNFVV